jgi:RNA polymerase sigma-70 factor (ECF subfamily)
LQQTFMNAHVARSAFARGADPLPWLRTIARRLLVDEMRRRERLQRAVARVEHHGATHHERVEPFEQAEQACLDERRSALARNALEELPERQRRAVTLTKLEGYSVAAAAVALGTTAAAVKLRAHRGYASLRSKLALLVDGEEERLPLAGAA